MSEPMCETCAYHTGLEPGEEQYCTGDNPDCEIVGEIIKARAERDAALSRARRAEKALAAIRSGEAVTLEQLLAETPDKFAEEALRRIAGLEALVDENNRLADAGAEAILHRMVIAEAQVAELRTLVKLMMPCVGEDPLSNVFHCRVCPMYDDESNHCRIPPDVENMAEDIFAAPAPQAEVVAKAVALAEAYDAYISRVGVSNVSSQYNVRVNSAFAAYRAAHAAEKKENTDG